MIYSVIPSDVIFFDRNEIRERRFKMYNDITLEFNGSRVERIISTKPDDFIRYGHLIGKELKDENFNGKIDRNFGEFML